MPRMPKLDDEGRARTTYVLRTTRLDDLRHHRLDVARTRSRSRPGMSQRNGPKRRAAHFHYNDGCADPRLLLGHLSARYDGEARRWNDVEIEIYYHPAHAYNVDRMIEAVKESLDYYTTNFGAYQHQQVAHHRVPALRALRAVVPEHHPLLRGDRLHRATPRQREESTTSTTSRRTRSRTSGGRTR